jgi:cyclopropane fatty-acyl-phospholipid synthase-like methyltransferase
MTETETAVIDEGEFFSTNTNRFDVTVAFSVFTHFDPTMAAHYLKALNDMTKPTGHLLLTWFLDHPDNPRNSPGCRSEWEAVKALLNRAATSVWPSFHLWPLHNSRTPPAC